MSYNDVIRSAERTVLRLSERDIESIVISVYDEPMSQYIRNELISKLIARRNYIIEYVRRHKPRQSCRTPSPAPRSCQPTWGDTFRSVRDATSTFARTYGPNLQQRHLQQQVLIIYHINNYKSIIINQY